MRARQWAVVAVVSCLTLATTAPLVRANTESAPPGESETRTKKPPLSGVRILGELALGGAAAFVTLYPGALSGVVVECVVLDCDDGEEVIYLRDSAFLGAYLGYGVGFGVGVALAGKIGKQTGSLPIAIAGGAMGVGLGLATRRTGAPSSMQWTVGLSAPAIGALLAFNLTRRYDPAPAGRLAIAPAAIVVGDGGLHPGVPAFYVLTDNRFPERRATMLNLVAGSF